MSVLKMDGMSEVCGSQQGCIMLFRSMRQGRAPISLSEANPAGLDWPPERIGTTSRPPPPARANPNLMQPCLRRFGKLFNWPLCCIIQQNQPLSLALLTPPEVM